MSENIEALMEDLQTLRDAVPLLTKSVDEAREGAEALEAAAHELDGEVEDARRETAARVAAVNGVLPALGAQLAGAETRLEESAAAAGAAWEAAQPALAHAGETLVKHVDQAVSHVHDLRAALGNARSTIEESRAAGEAALSRLESDLLDAEVRLRAALEALDAQVDSFQGYAQTAKEAIDNKGIYLKRCLLSALDVTAAHVHDTLAAMESTGVGHQIAARSEIPTLGVHLMEQLGDADSRIEQGITALVTEAAGSLRGELERLGAGADTQEQELARHGQALDAARADVRREADAMPTALAVVEEAARQVGL
jgi:hypothetical protein